MRRLLEGGVYQRAAFIRGTTVSDATKLCLRKSKLLSAVIPGGCTGFIQTPDVCLNKPFKDHYTKAYDDWFQSGNQEFTAGGNPKAAPLETIVEWIMSVWAKVNREIIINSFKVCGLTNKLDGSEDDEIIVFKEN